jgi:hypothetical protein
MQNKRRQMPHGEIPAMGGQASTARGMTLLRQGFRGQAARGWAGTVGNVTGGFRLRQGYGGQVRRRLEKHEAGRGRMARIASNPWHARKGRQGKR